MCLLSQRRAYIACITDNYPNGRQWLREATALPPHGRRAVWINLLMYRRNSLLRFAISFERKLDAIVRRAARRAIGHGPYVGTSLSDTLARLRPHRVLVTGWATDFCVDATVRSIVSHNYPVVAVSDAHTLSDRRHLPATTVLAHHDWIWSGLITNCSVHVVSTDDLLAESASPRRE